MGDDEYLLVIRWDSDGSVREAQKMTTTASVISDWLGRTAQFVSFDTTFSVYQHEAAQ
jgi:hypothetical protein